MAPGHFLRFLTTEKKLASDESLARVCSVNQQIGKDKKNRKEFKKGTNMIGVLLEGTHLPLLQDQPSLA
jgi:hypothetical protein